MTWNLAETFGTPPLPRHGHTANILMNYLVIFGGANEKDIFHDVTMLNLRNMEWIIPNICGQIPRGVVYHAAVSASNNELIVIGGKTEGKKYIPGVLILKPKRERRKSFCITSPSFE